MTSINHPPMPDSFIHAINLTTADSKITAVSVYTDRAEVTRSFRIQLQTGQNHVKITRLPNVLQDDSVRLEGRGPVTIHDVAVAFDPVPPKVDTSPVMDDLMSRKEHTLKELERCKSTRDAIGKYLATLNAEHVAVDRLDNIFQGCDATAAKLDDKALNLHKQLVIIDNEMQEERQKDQAKKSGKLQWLRNTVTLSLFSEKECDAEVVLIYAVTGASWTAQYDVRVDLQSKETPVTLIYKAAVTQNTAEDWEDVPLRLETATPTYQVGLPSLSPWSLSIRSPVPAPVMVQRAAPTQPRMRGKITARRTSTFLASVNAEESEEGEVDAMVPCYFTPASAIVTSRGNVSATFDVPGTITIPSDGAAHNVTITELNNLEAAMSWIAIPKCDARTRLSAKIKNASEYTLLSGTGSVYVDGSFISKSTIPAVSPGESFDCALGLDPAIRIVYHQLSKKSAKSGFYTKTSVTSYTQRITIHNTKARTIADLRIVDQIPVSTDEKIVVKLFNPPLPSVQPNVGGAKAGEKSANNSGAKVRVAPGVLAHWGDGTEDATAVDDGTSAVGKDGKLSWICEVPSQGKMNVMLQWEVTAPAQAHVVDT